MGWDHYITDILDQNHEKLHSHVEDGLWENSQGAYRDMLNMQLLLLVGHHFEYSSRKCLNQSKSILTIFLLNYASGHMKTYLKTAFYNYKKNINLLNIN